MFWTLILVLCLGCGVGAAYLYKFKVIDPKKNYIPPPSTAFIDQVLPTEIIHMMMLESDLQTLLNISEVSKYWNYLSNQDFIRYTVYKKEGSFRPTIEEFVADQQTLQNNNANFIPYESMQWLSYDRETYPHHWLVEDVHLSKKLNKKIIDASLASVHQFELGIGFVAGGLTRNVYDCMNKYLVKLRLESVAVTVLDNWKFRQQNTERIMILPKNKIKSDWKFLEHISVEIIADMIEVYPGAAYFNTVHRYRVIDTRKYIAGIVPIDKWLAFVMFVLFLPCLAMDVWTMPSGAQYVIYYISSLISLISIFGFAAGVLWQGKEKEHIKGYIFFLSIIVTILLVGLIVTPWIITLRIALFIAVLHLTSLYFANTWKYLTQSYHQYARAILGYFGVMALFVIDWKLMADSLKSGTTWLTLLYNCLIYVGYVVFLMYLNFGRHTIVQRIQRTWTFKKAMMPDKPLQLYLIASAAVTVLLALCAPNLYTAL